MILDPAVQDRAERAAEVRRRLANLTRRLELAGRRFDEGDPWAYAEWERIAGALVRLSDDWARERTGLPPRLDQVTVITPPEGVDL